MNLSGKYGWIAYHEQLFGRDRLRNYLFPSLSTDSKHIAVIDFSVLYKVTIDRVIINGSIYKRWILPFTYKIQSIPDLKTEYSDIVTISEKNVYFMDAASIIVCCLLNVDIDSTILDLCSAPGGKSLILIRRILENVCYESNLTNLKCKVTCNEFNYSRFERLKRVLVSHIGELNMKRLNVETVSVDATSKSISCFFTKKFLSIIVDAPCSSDRHLILSNTLQNWSLKSAKENQKRQVRILRNALGLLEPNGTLLYCTCTLNEKENDDTIEYICKKEGIDSELCLLSLVYTIDKFNNTYSQIEVCIQPLSEKYRKDTINISKHRFANSKLGMEEYDKIIFEYSKFGAYILPDKNNGIGPLYISIINK